MLQLGLLVVASQSRLARFLAGQFAVYLNPQVGVIRFRGLQLELRIESIPLQLRVAQLQHDRVAPDSVSRTHYDAVHARLRLRGDPANIFRDKRPKTADVAHHGAAPNRVFPRGAVVHTWRSRTKLGQPVGDPAERKDADDNADNHPPGFLSLD